MSEQAQCAAEREMQALVRQEVTELKQALQAAHNESLVTRKNNASKNSVLESELAHAEAVIAEKERIIATQHRDLVKLGNILPQAEVRTNAASGLFII